MLYPLLPCSPSHLPLSSLSPTSLPPPPDHFHCWAHFRRSEGILPRQIHSFTSWVSVWTKKLQKYNSSPSPGSLLLCFLHCIIDLWTAKERQDKGWYRSYTIKPQDRLKHDVPVLDFSNYGDMPMHKIAIDLTECGITTLPVYNSYNSKQDVNWAVMQWYAYLWTHACTQAHLKSYFSYIPTATLQWGDSHLTPPAQCIYNLGQLGSFWIKWYCSHMLSICTYSEEEAYKKWRVDWNTQS